MTEAPPEVKWWNPFSWSAGQAYSDARDADTREYYATTRPDLYDEVNDNLTRDTAEVDVYGEISEEFTGEALSANLKTSASEAGKAVGNAAGSVVQAAGNFAANALLGFPLWFWLALAVAAFFYLGGANLIRARVARAAA